METRRVTAWTLRLGFSHFSLFVHIPINCDITHQIWETYFKAMKALWNKMDNIYAIWSCNSDSSHDGKVEAILSWNPFPVQVKGHNFAESIVLGDWSKGNQPKLQTPTAQFTIYLHVLKLPDETEPETQFSSTFRHFPYTNDSIHKGFQYHHLISISSKNSNKNCSIT